ncbi:hypothetical protein [Actinophytocola sp.]|uniref:hypothetical protein n=1 Tax=Actinophytocola sp. TaxID=1872138 RepID=UPI00345BE51B
MSRTPARRGPLTRALLSLAVLAVTTYLLMTTAPRLGLDLRGGTQIVLETRDSPTTKADEETTDRTLEVLRRRVDALGVAEPMLARSGTNRIVVELPDVRDPAEAVEVIGRTAALSFHPVLDPAAPAAKVLPDESGQQLPLGPAALSGDGVTDASAARDPQGVGWAVGIEFRDGEAWRRLTADAACALPATPPAGSRSCWTRR